MRPNIRTLLLIATGCLYAFSGMAQNRYKLVWKDDFKGKTFNSANWSKIPRGGADWQRHMSDYDGCYEVKKDNLILRGIVNDCCPSDSSRYLTGGLYTKGKRNITYGKVEVRAKLQGARGAWPAIWMLPDGHAQWPEGGEIDIMERLNHDSIAYQTVHTYYTFVLKQGNKPPHGAVGRINPGDYNTYSVEILPDSLVFAINGKRTFSYPRIETPLQGQYPFGKPFYLLIDMQLEGSWVGRANPDELPVAMWVDWVKMYELKQPRTK